MKKPKPIEKKTYYSIGEVSDILKIRDYVIRFWEKEFSHLKPMIAKKGNRRKYSLKDIQIIRYINFLVHEKGYTLAGAKNQLNIEMENNPHFFQNIEPDWFLNKISDSIQKKKKDQFTSNPTSNPPPQYASNELHNKLLDELYIILKILNS